MDSTNGHFRYPLLDRDPPQIRLLTLDHIDEDGLVHLTLECVPLNSVLTALSHRWGEDKATHAVRLNDQEFFVQRGVLDFLTTIADTQYCRRRFFIDAICIDQMNMRESEQQVGLMRSIYFEAEEVIAWLGPQPELPHSDDEDGADNENTVVQNEYWTRLWIVQEVVLAHKLTIMLGTITISPDSLVKIAKKYDNTSLWPARFEADAVERKRRSNARINPQASPSHLRQRTRSAGSAYMVLLRRNRWQQTLHSLGPQSEQHSAEAAVRLLPPLHEILVRFGAQQSSRRLDKVFGLLDLGRSRIRADYTIEPTELFVRVFIEGLYELTKGDEYPARNPVTMKRVAHFRAVCLHTLENTSQTVLLLIQFRCLQHCRVIPREGRGANVYLGLRSMFLTDLWIFYYTARPDYLRSPTSPMKRPLVGRNSRLFGLLCFIGALIFGNIVRACIMVICIDWECTEALEALRGLPTGRSNQETRTRRRCIDLVDKIAKEVIGIEDDVHRIPEAQNEHRWQQLKLRGVMTSLLTWWAVIWMLLARIPHGESSFATTRVGALYMQLVTVLLAMLAVELSATTAEMLSLHKHGPNPASLYH